jgi:hypothetical protein
VSLWQGCDWSFLIGPWIADAKKWCGKRPLSEPFLHFKTIVLPRQARDKHNETLTNERRYVFCRRANATDAPENYYEWQARSQVSTWWPVAPSDEDKQTKNYTSGPPLDGCALHLPPAAHPHTPPPSSGHTHTHTKENTFGFQSFSLWSHEQLLFLCCAMRSQQRCNNNDDDDDTHADANKHWNGLIGDFYKARVQCYVDQVSIIYICALCFRKF